MIKGLQSFTGYTTLPLRGDHPSPVQYLPAARVRESVNCTVFAQMPSSLATVQEAEVLVSQTDEEYNIRQVGLSRKHSTPEAIKGVDLGAIIWSYNAALYRVTEDEWDGSVERADVEYTHVKYEDLVDGLEWDQFAEDPIYTAWITSSAFDADMTLTVVFSDSNVSGIELPIGPTYVTGALRSLSCNVLIEVDDPIRHFDEGSTIIGSAGSPSIAFGRMGEDWEDDPEDEDDVNPDPGDDWMLRNEGSVTWSDRIFDVPYVDPQPGIEESGPTE